VLRAELERTAGECGVIAGFVNQTEIPLALSLADVLVLSSEFEPYGMVVAEAQALGTPRFCAKQQALNRRLGDWRLEANVVRHRIAVRAVHRHRRLQLHQP
jgi:glycosyltransferase involved in cell wall biosynthesis